MTQITFNRLLDYRSLDQLERMNDSDRASLLAEILRQPPSENGWQALWELLATWPEGASRTQGIDVALQGLAAWPDRLRFLYSANHLLYEGNQLSERARLVRSIEVHRREQQGSAELRMIVSSEYAAGLKRLSIERSEIDSRAWQALAESPNLSGLEHLHVRKTLPGSAIVEHLFQAARFPRLRCLKLIDAGIRPNQLQSLGQGTGLAELCALDLSANAVGDDGALTLSRLTPLPKLRRLSLRETYMGGRMIQALLSSSFCQRMEHMDVAGNRVTQAEKDELLRFAAGRNLELLL